MVVGVGATLGSVLLLLLLQLLLLASRELSLHLRLRVTRPLPVDVVHPAKQKPTFEIVLVPVQLWKETRAYIFYRPGAFCASGDTSTIRKMNFLTGTAALPPRTNEIKFQSHVANTLVLKKL